jgi:hypothetical protein
MEKNEEDDVVSKRGVSFRRAFLASVLIAASPGTFCT